MPIFTNKLLFNNPVIEFQIKSGKILQLISNLNVNSFGPLKSKLVITDTDTSIQVELNSCEEDEYTIGIFYNQFGFKCLSSNDYILQEYRARLKIPPWYNPKVGFYKIGTKIACPEWNRLSVNNKIIREWEFTSKGWITPTKYGDGIISLN